jgi:hypothetical protein
MRAARRAKKQRFYDPRHVQNVQVLHDQVDAEGERGDTLEKAVRSKYVRRDV